MPRVRVTGIHNQLVVNKSHGLCVIGGKFLIPVDGLTVNNDEMYNFVEVTGHQINDDDCAVFTYLYQNISGNRLIAFSK